MAALFSRTLLSIFLIIPCLLSAQDREFTGATFLGTRVINGHSVVMLREGEMEMIINHRFGRINSGANELFGLDQSNIRIGLDYGIKDWLTVGAGRSSLGKEFDGLIKLRLLRQAKNGGSPISVTGFASTAYNSAKVLDPARPLVAQNRFAFTYQLLFARKFSDRFSLQIMPAAVHYNLVASPDLTNDIVSIGAAFRYKMSKNLALTGEYFHRVVGTLPTTATNPISIGLDINTGSHVFQLHLTNSSAMIEKQFIGETTGDIFKGDLHLGFNIVRTFKVKGRRY
jgi:hypothetical protein